MPESRGEEMGQPAFSEPTLVQLRAAVKRSYTGLVAQFGGILTTMATKVLTNENLRMKEANETSNMRPKPKKKMSS